MTPLDHDDLSQEPNGNPAIGAYWKQRLAFSLLFIIGTFLAAWGWMAELRNSGEHLESLTIVGHAMQVVGAFGHLMTPDATVEDDEEEEEDPFYAHLPRSSDRQMGNE